MSALLIGMVLAVLGLAFVLYPILVAPPARARRLAPQAPPESSAIDALREIEFDRQTGKLSDADYASLKLGYTERALVELRARPSAAPDAAEMAILAYRLSRPSCPLHGARPERDAAYCSECGRHLAGACAECGAPVTEPAARYCAGCGAALAA